jgi:hypothetical protein
MAEFSKESYGPKWAVLLVVIMLVTTFLLLGFVL